MRRNVEEFLSPPRQKDMELKCPLGQTFCRDSRFPLSFCRNVRYNEDINDFEGGEPHDKRRGIAALFYRSGYHIVACAVASILLHEKAAPQTVTKKPPIPTEQTVISGTPGAIRTHGLWSRSPALYPAELRARVHDIVYRVFRAFVKRLLRGISVGLRRNTPISVLRLRVIRLFLLFALAIAVLLGENTAAVILHVQAKLTRLILSLAEARTKSRGADTPHRIFRPFARRSDASARDSGTG